MNTFVCWFWLYVRSYCRQTNIKLAVNWTVKSVGIIAEASKSYHCFVGILNPNKCSVDRGRQTIYGAEDSKGLFFFCNLGQIF